MIAKSGLAQLQRFEFRASPPCHRIASPMPRLPLFLALCGARAVSSWAAAPRGVGAAAHRSARPIMAGWMDYLKFGGSTPSFDVLAKTREYTSTPGYRAFRLRDIPTDYYADDYVFRGPIVGPFNRDDLVSTNLAFGLDSAFPDLERSAFGFTVDPENPYRVLFFERWKGTNSGPIAISQASLPTTPCTLHAVHPAPCTLHAPRSSLLAPLRRTTHLVLPPCISCPSCHRPVARARAPSSPSRSCGTRRAASCTST